MYELTTCRLEQSTLSSLAVHQEAGTTGSPLRLRMFWSEQTLLGLIQNQPTEKLAHFYYNSFGMYTQFWFFPYSFKLYWPISFLTLSYLITFKTSGVMLSKSKRVNYLTELTFSSPFSLMSKFCGFRSLCSIRL